MELGLARRVRAALPVGALDLALDALDRGSDNVVLLLERVCHLLDGEPGGLPLDAVDRAACREDRDEHEQQATAAEHPGSLPEPRPASFEKRLNRARKHSPAAVDGSAQSRRTSVTDTSQIPG